MLGAFSGDHVLAPAAGHMLGDIAGQAKLASEAPDRQAKAELHAEQMRAIKEKNNANATPEAAQMLRGMLEKYGITVPEGTQAPTMREMMGNAKDAYKVDENNQRARDTAGLMTQARKEASDAKEAARQQQLSVRDEQFNERELNQLGKGDQKLRAALAAKEAAEKLIARMDEAGGDVPGIGRIQSKIPTILTPDSWQLNQADAMEMAKSVLLMKGGAITPKAIEAQMKALGLSAGSDVNTFKHGLGTALDEVATGMRQREAGFRPANVAEFKNRGGLTSDMVHEVRARLKGNASSPKAPAASTEPTVKTDAEYDALPSGTVYIDAEDGKRKKKR